MKTEWPTLGRRQAAGHAPDAGLSAYVIRTEVTLPIIPPMGSAQAGEVVPRSRRGRSAHRRLLPCFQPRDLGNAQP
jgi:hypothetical protein